MRSRDAKVAVSGRVSCVPEAWREQGVRDVRSKQVHRVGPDHGLDLLEPDKQDFVSLLNLVDEPLATLPLDRIRPGREVLEEVMESLR